MNILDYNRQAWDGLVERGNQWTLPVTPEVVAAARRGDWQVVLTPQRAVPREWFPEMRGTRTLCLAGAGGQQGPVLAAAGAVVTVFDNSPRQLARDREVADRDGLALTTVQGDMRDLGVFADGSFDLVVHPCSNSFVPDVQPVWREVSRVLAPGGTLLAGFLQPVAFVFDEAAAERGEIVVRHRLPYSDEASLTASELQQLLAAGEPLMFSHSFEDLLGGQLAAGLVVRDLYEDTWPGKPWSVHLPSTMATRAQKPPA